MIYAVGDALKIERLGGELLVFDAAGQVVHRLSGVGRARFEQAVEGGLVELPDDQATAALEAAGLIVAMAEPAGVVAGMTRRRALIAGAAAAAVGVVTLVLPKAAAAQSAGPGPEPSTSTSTTSSTAPPPPGPSGFALATIQSGSGDLNLYWDQGAYGLFTYNYTVTGAVTADGTLNAKTTFELTKVGTVPLNGTVFVTMTSNTVGSTTATFQITRTS